MKTPLLAALAVCIAASPTDRAASILAAQSPTPPSRLVSSRDGLVVSASSFASDIGASILTSGGNAVDAACATAFALAVTYPFAGNIGGGGFMIVRRPSGKTAAIDYREMAPARSTPTMYLDDAGNIDRRLTASGYLAPGVPGTVRGLALAHKRFGRLRWADVVTPAAQLADSGFAISESLAHSLNVELAGPMSRFPASMAAYGKPGGGEWQAGDRLVLPDLARSLRAIAAGGPDAFYEGWIADRIAEDMARNGGLISKEDLERYRAKSRTPITTTFLGYDVTSMPPPSSGGATLAEMLNVLEALHVENTERLSAPAIHLMVEAMRRAYLDRARYLGDPDFSKIPVKLFVSKAHARDLIKDFEPARASSSADLGKDILTAPQTPEPEHTTHFSVLDRDGMAVASTYTLEGGYGSHVVIAGTGILLNNEMGDFNKKPGTTNLTGDIGTQPNLIAPRKRMLSSMTPTIVSKNGKLVLITGSPGSRTIINTVLGIVLSVTAWRLDGAGAVDGPRIDHEWLPDRVTIEADGVPEAVRERLEAMGHEVRLQGRQGSAHSIWIDETGLPVGIPDLRDATPKASAGMGRARR
jgi:gamma-glutamyltranspeptidase/glutathione hydrolase